MILVDLQQVMIASIMMQMGKSSGKIEVPMFKHMVLNSLRSYRVSYGKRYGELVIACESKSNWRNQVFPYYKANRKKDREESALDWEGIFKGLNEMRADLVNYFPYRIISVEGCEADDVIGVLAHEYGSDLPGGSEQIMILSGDKDYKQLQTYMNVEQYDPVRKKSMRENNPSDFLTDLIISGDKGDGIPNSLSSDNSLVMNTRQTTISAKRRAEIKKQAVSGQWTDPVAQRGFIRNQQLIDLTYTPASLKSEVLEQYDSQAGKSRQHLFNYFMKNRMKHLMEYVQDF